MVLFAPWRVFLVLPVLLLAMTTAHADTPAAERDKIAPVITDGGPCGNREAVPRPPSGPMDPVGMAVPSPRLEQPCYSPPPRVAKPQNAPVTLEGPKLAQPTIKTPAAPKQDVIPVVKVKNITFRGTTLSKMGAFAPMGENWGETVAAVPEESGEIFGPEKPKKKRRAQTFEKPRIIKMP